MKSLASVLVGILLAAGGLPASPGEVQHEPIKGELKLIYVFDGLKRNSSWSLDSPVSNPPTPSSSISTPGLQAPN